MRILQCLSPLLQRWSAKYTGRLRLTGFVEEARRDNHECVEPSSRLIQTLCDEVCRKSLLKSIHVLKGVVQLCIGHRSGLKPAVKHLVNTL